MSEKEIEMGEEEVTMVDHWSHYHPLTLVKTRRGDKCNGCGRYFSIGEQVYGCSKHCTYFYLHEECAEMPIKIRHPMHPQHIIQQYKPFFWPDCAICEKTIVSFGYHCTSSEECRFQIDMSCVQNICGVEAADDDDEPLRHPSHPQHELRLLKRRCLFRCDACGTGTTQEGGSFVCTLCQYWIHKRCASLPNTMKREDHHHTLSLSFHVPLEYIKFEYKCDVCFRELVHWIYHCQLCRYVVHVKCAFNRKLHATTRNIANASIEKDIIRFPISEVEEQIRAFVMREGGAIPTILDDDEISNVMKYKFHNHKHHLNLISSPLSCHDNKSQEEEDSSDDDEDECRQKSKSIICDGCITPILQKKQASSSSKLYYYMSCGECKYFLHLACFHLPPQLPSLTFHHKDDHKLVLQSCAKLAFGEVCTVCGLYTNGLYYACTRCKFKADIKCASLPNTIYHAAHPLHLLKHVSAKDLGRDDYSRPLACGAGCGITVFYSKECYMCDICEYILHAECVVLPPSARVREWDKHPLPLTYDASVNHPSEFYCDHCEIQMNPKMWMYHCRRCDLSFHPECFPAISGFFRNIKFGQQYVIATAHPHPLTEQLLTAKRRCDVCRVDAYNYRGLHCASCNFSLCLDCWEGKLNDGEIQAID